MPLYEEKLISPLAIRFGQNRIKSTFKDGHTLDETLAQITPVAAPEGSNHKLLLHAPFPPIEVVRWRPKLRGDDGVALENASGETLHGEECWFTLDNRRLYCLQRVAVRLLSQGVAACVVRIMYDIPTVKSVARKFKTTTSGTRVRVDHHRDQAPLLNWEWESLKQVKRLRAAGGCEALAQVSADKRARDLSLLVDAPESIDVREDALGTHIESDLEEFQVREDGTYSKGSMTKQEKLPQQNEWVVDPWLQQQQQMMVHSCNDVAMQQVWYAQYAWQWDTYCAFALQLQSQYASMPGFWQPPAQQPVAQPCVGEASFAWL